jgi:endonuclease/exonuclease/phosphatase family metal-dependent hydrolase
MSTHLRIATYNIHKCRGLDRRVRPARIVQVLREIDADIVAMQEVISAHGRGEDDQAQFIAAELGFHFCFGENRHLGGAPYGNLLLSRYPLSLIQNHDISTDGRERRGCLRADIRIAETTFHLFNVHLGTSFFERRRQARKLIDTDILGDSKLLGVRIICGDFNEWTRGLTTQVLTRSFRSIDIRSHLGRPRTYPGIIPLVHLDHIYFDGSLKLDHAVLHRSRTALMASDHLPLVAEFQVDNVGTQSIVSIPYRANENSTPRNGR